MKNILQYKGYHTKIEFDTETFLLRGKIEGINDLVTFESKDPTKIEKEFHAAVDDYLEFCEEVGKEPDKEYKGTFNVRISPKLHKELALVAYKNGETLNSIVEKAIDEYVNGISRTNTQLQQTIKILSETLETQSIYKKQFPIDAESKIDVFEMPNIRMTYRERG